MTAFHEYNSDIYVSEGKLNDLYLLQSNKKAVLSSFYLDGFSVSSITNASFFTSSYVLGRNQGDMSQDTHSDNEVYCDFAITNDGYKAGQLHSWDVTQSRCGYSPCAILILDGKDTELISSAYYNLSSLKTRNPQSALAVLKDKTVLEIVVDGRGTSKGMTAYEVREFIKIHYPSVECLCINDGGGSAELIVNGKIINNPSDGKERSMFNGLALLKRKEAVTDKSFMWLERLTNTNMADNPYWYSLDYNWFAKNDLWLPNCTNYACGRSCEIAGKSIKNEIPKGNAQNWYDASNWIGLSKPEIGSILVWSGGKYGHVAICERINYSSDGSISSILISQSNYNRGSQAERNKNYFELWEIEAPIVGKVTDKVGLTFLGALRNPYVNDIRVKRDETKKQVEVTAEKVRARKSAGGDAYGLFIPLGIYDVLEESGNWLKIFNNVWFSKGEWATLYYPKEDNTELINSLNAKIDTLEDEKQKQEQILAETQNSLNTAQNELNTANEKIAKIREIVQ